MVRTVRLEALSLIVELCGAVTRLFGNGWSLVTGFWPHLPAKCDVDRAVSQASCLEIHVGDRFTILVHKEF